jgi:hypothetical protein
MLPMRRNRRKTGWLHHFALHCKKRFHRDLWSVICNKALGNSVDAVENYLGSTIDRQGGSHRDVTARIVKARTAFVTLKNIWASKEISLRIKLRIFNSNVKPVLLLTINY